MNLNFVKTLVDIIYPKRCPYCNNVINRDALCCCECNKNIKACSNIRKIPIRDSNLETTCISPLKYEGDFVKAFHRFKFRGYKSYANEFASRMVKSIKSNFSDCKFDVITSVPLSSKRKYERGYNQAELLSKIIAKELSIPHEDLLIKVKKNKIQHKLSHDERIENVKGAYLAKNLDIINGSNILLCDDVITTGSTLAECAKMLLDSNAKSVMCVTIANVK